MWTTVEAKELGVIAMPNKRAGCDAISFSDIPHREVPPERLYVDQ